MPVMKVVLQVQPVMPILLGQDTWFVACLAVGLQSSCGTWQPALTKAHAARLCLKRKGASSHADSFARAVLGMAPVSSGLCLAFCGLDDLIVHDVAILFCKWPRSVFASLCAVTIEERTETQFRTRSLCHSFLTEVTLRGCALSAWSFRLVDAAQQPIVTFQSVAERLRCGHKVSLVYSPPSACFVVAPLLVSVF